MKIKNINVPVMIALFLYGENALSAVYCGVVNGVQVWDELVPSNCAKALRDMQLSNEHIQSSQKGRQVEEMHGAPSSKAVESAITSIGDYLQKGADERADAERAAWLKNDAEIKARDQALFSELSKQILSDYPKERISKVDCNSGEAGLGVLKAPNFSSDLIAEALAQTYSVTIPQLRSEVNRFGKKESISTLDDVTAKARSMAYDGFHAAGVDSVASLKEVQSGVQRPIVCEIAYANVKICQYIMGRYMADALVTVRGVIDKCIK